MHGGATAVSNARMITVLISVSQSGVAVAVRSNIICWFQGGDGAFGNGLGDLSGIAA
jgi:hypothetical protein